MVVARGSVEARPAWTKGQWEMAVHVQRGPRGLVGGLRPVAAVSAAASAAALVLGVQPPASAASALVDVTSAAGLAESNESFSANPFDYDADGDEDVLVNYHDQGAKLWRNDGGTFTWVARSAFPALNDTGTMIDRHDCTWADVDRDRLTDVYCSVGRGAGGALKTGDHPDNELWLQRADGSFVDRGTEWGVGDPYGRGRDVVFLDANGDRWPDLYVGNELPRPGDAGGDALGSSKLFLNDGGDSFVAAPAFGLDHHHGGRCALAADLDGDEDEDLVMCGPYGVRVYRSTAPAGFWNATEESGFPTHVSNGIEKSHHYYRDADLADLDGDGDLDLVGIRGERLTYRLNDGRGVFDRQKAVEHIAGGREVATGDADGDGDVDIYALSTNDPDTDKNLDDALFLNDDLKFSGRVAPSATGRGDTVEALDYDTDGDADFLVLNGQDVAGPVQLLSLRGR